MDRTELSNKIVSKPLEVGVIIVTHNSEASIDQTLEALSRQTHPPVQVQLIDSGSSSGKYLKKYDHQGQIEMCFMSNIGFSAANNLGYSSLISTIDFVLFLNPDLILTDDFIEKAVLWLSDKKRDNVAALTGPLIGWDLAKNQSTGRLDSTGIFSTWYGKWYDRGQGESAKYHPYKKEESIPAICGALFFAKKAALESVKIGPSEIFDKYFFCYKEDIDLSLRLTRAGWKLYYVPELISYHARGWQDRSRISRKLRLMSAENELRLHLKTKNPIRIIYSYIKWIGVRVFNL